MQNYSETLKNDEDSWQETLNQVELDDLSDFQVENLAWEAWGE